MNTIKNLIKRNGHRFTFQKKEIYCVLKHKPQTVAEIYLAVNSKKKIMDKTTVYRILASFLTIGIVNKVQLNEKEVRFELKNSKHHHHLVCMKCGRIEDIQLSEEMLLREVKKKSDFNIMSHSLEFFGICNHCQ